MTQEQRINITKEIYIKNLKEKAKKYGLNDKELKIAIKFIENYASYIIWSIHFDKGN